MATKKKAKPKKKTTSGRASKPPAKKKVTKKAPAKKTAARKAPKKAPPAPANPIVHWEIQSQNPGTLIDFYANAFGWKIDANNPMQYGMVTSGGGAGSINGGIGGSPPIPGAPGSRVLVYAAVKSIDAALARIESLGGTVIMPRTDVGPVIMALYQDPEGHAMGLIEA